MDDLLTIAGKSYSSRLLVGTGKYKDFGETRAAIDASGAQIVTVAIRRTNIGQDPNAPSLLDALPPSRFTYLPNTAGCYTADDAIRTCRLARELGLARRDLVGGGARALVEAPRAVARVAGGPGHRDRVEPQPPGEPARRGGAR